MKVKEFLECILENVKVKVKSLDNSHTLFNSETASYKNYKDLAATEIVIIGIDNGLDDLKDKGTIILYV